LTSEISKTSKNIFPRLILSNSLESDIKITEKAGCGEASYRFAYETEINKWSCRSVV
jgi:hypothetical protein